MSDFSEAEKNNIAQVLTPEIYERFREAIATGRWPNGVALTDDQKSTCMQAVIVFESTHVAPEQRTGYVPPKETPCAPKSEEQDTPLSWK